MVGLEEGGVGAMWALEGGRPTERGGEVGVFPWGPGLIGGPEHLSMPM